MVQVSNKIVERAADDHGPRHRLLPEEMKHSFAMSRIAEASEEDAGSYLCHCVRCKRTFQVNPSTGSIRALDGTAEPLDDDVEATKRIDSFAHGLCPAFCDLPEYKDAVAASYHGIFGILHPMLHLLGLDSATE